MNATRVFIHGLESTGKGTKGVFFRERYPDMIIEDYVGNFQERMRTLEGHLAGKSGFILVGSSYGGLMAATYACLYSERVEKLILLAPALHLEEFRPCLDKRLRIPVTIFHGNMDEVVPLAAVRAIADSLFVNLTFNIVEDDHSLHETFAAYDWNTLLSPQAVIRISISGIPFVLFWHRPRIEGRYSDLNGDILEKYRGMIAIAGIGKDYDNNFVFIF